MKSSASEPSSVSGPVQVGNRAPDFSLPNQRGELIRLSDFTGKRAVVLYFYPKDNTAGCTREACAFRDSYEAFTDAGAEVIGVSSDPPDSHAGFAGQHRLPFILLSDAGGAVRKRYGVPRTFGLLPGRVTYVIDRDGIVRHIFSNLFAAERHVTEALKTLTET